VTFLLFSRLIDRKTSNGAVKMKDKRNEILARQLLDYSVKLKKGEILYLEIKGKETLELGKELIKYATGKGAVPWSGAILVL
jgi:hypothetical protein